MKKVRKIKIIRFPPPKQLWTGVSLPKRRYTFAFISFTAAAADDDDDDFSLSESDEDDESS
jgi:hypothetical protein